LRKNWALSERASTAPGAAAAIGMLISCRRTLGAGWIEWVLWLWDGHKAEPVDTRNDEKED
jgi:hypothetical protein